jgi:hypothetical protein
MAAVGSAYDEAKRFLRLHPWSTTDVDNPVELLGDLVGEIESGELPDLSADDDGVDDGDEDDRQSETLDKLMAFVKGLRDDLKISEAEYRIALSLVDDGAQDDK